MNKLMKQFIVFFIGSFGILWYPKGFTHAKQVVEQTRQHQVSKTNLFNTITTSVVEKAEHSETDGTIYNEYQMVLKIDEKPKILKKKVSLVELSMQNKSNYRKAAFNKQLASRVSLRELIQPVGK